MYLVNKKGVISALVHMQSSWEDREQTCWDSDKSDKEKVGGFGYREYEQVNVYLH